MIVDIDRLISIVDMFTVIVTLYLYLCGVWQRGQAESRPASSLAFVAEHSWRGSSDAHLSTMVVTYRDPAPLFQRFRTRFGRT